MRSFSLSVFTLVFSTLLLACDGLVMPSISSMEETSSMSSSSEPTSVSTSASTSEVPSSTQTGLSQDEQDAIFSNISISIPYLTEDFVLPTFPNNPSFIQWSSEHATIEQGVLKYPTLTQDTTIELIARFTFDNLTYEKSFPLLVKSQLHAPNVLNKGHLNINLGANRDETSILYESTLLASMDVHYDQHGTMMTVEDVGPLTIRTRGHSTRLMPKRSYRIRFDENTSLLGMKSAKNYILLANYIDHSQVRNALVHYTSHFFDSLYSIDYRFVDVSFNGVYQGNYLLTERVEFHRNRLNVPFLSQDPSFDVGFLVELDIPGVDVGGEGQIGVDYFRINERPYVMKEPNLDSPGYDARHFQYIETYMRNVDSRLRARQDVSQLIDIDNWIDYFLLQELTKNVDVGWGSVYMVKAPGEPLRHMPLWDFDISMGLGNYFDSGPQGHWGWADQVKNDFFTLMMQYPTIKQAFKARLVTFESTILPHVLSWLTTNEQPLTDILEDNFEIWPLNVCEGLWCPIVQPLLEVDEYADHLDFIRDFLTTRLAWMKNNIV